MGEVPLSKELLRPPASPQSICSRTSALLSSPAGCLLEVPISGKDFDVTGPLDPLLPSTGDPQAQPVCHQHISLSPRRSHYPPGSGLEKDKGPLQGLGTN